MPSTDYRPQSTGRLDSQRTDHTFQPTVQRYIAQPQTERKYINPPIPQTAQQHPLTSRKVSQSPQVITINYTPLKADNPYNQPLQRGNSRAGSIGSRRGSYRGSQRSTSPIQPMSARQQYGYTPNGSVDRHMPAATYRDYRNNSIHSHSGAQTPSQQPVVRRIAAPQTGTTA